MIVYHGSIHKNLKSLEFVKENSRTELTEGEGVYLTESLDIAKSYGGSDGVVYFVNISGKILDTTKPLMLETILIQIGETFAIDLLTVPRVVDVIEKVVAGHGSIQYFGKSIQLVLDNDADFYKLESTKGENFSEIIKTKIQERIDEHVAIRYRDNSINQAKSIIYVVKNPSCIEIVKEVAAKSAP
jgi:hypothetical protein